MGESAPSGAQPQRRAYTIREAAALYGVSTATIKRATHRTEPPFLRAEKVGGRYRIHEVALAEWWDQLPDACRGRSGVAMTTREEAIRAAGRRLAASDLAQAQMTPREQAEAAWTPTSRIRVQRGLRAQQVSDLDARGGESSAGASACPA